MKYKEKEEGNTNTEIESKSQKKRKSSEEEQYRVVISKEANEALEELTRKTNNGFLGGEVTKSDVANLIFLNSLKSFSENDVKTLRNLHFDEHKMLKALLRGANKESDLPDEIRKALREHYGLNEQSKRRSHRAPLEISTEKNVDNSSAA